MLTFVMTGVSFNQDLFNSYAMIGTNGQNAETVGVSLPPVPIEVAPVFDPAIPASPIDDLSFVRQALTDQGPMLRRRYSQRSIAFADRAVTRELGALIGEWVDPNGDADTALAEVRDMLSGCRDKQQTTIEAHYGDNTMPPDALDPVKPWDAKLREVDELIIDRLMRPAPTHPTLSPYYLGPVRTAILLEATMAPDEAVRAAARDLAERRLVLSTPRIARRLRRARHSAWTIAQMVLS